MLKQHWQRRAHERYPQMSLQEHVVAAMVRGGFALASIGSKERTTAARILKPSLMPEAAAEICLKRFSLVGLMDQARPG